MRRRQALDVAAFTGVGALGLGALQTWPRVRAGRVGRVQTIVEPSFGAWADDLWEANRGRYSILAVRDAATLNDLLPQGRWPDALVLRVVRDRRTVGWAAVRDHQMEGDVRFGDLRVGSVIDAFAAPADARLVTRAASRFLEQRSVDLIATNFSHPAWVSAFRASGFIVVPERRLFAVSKSFSAAVPNLESLLDGMHLSSLDGDGPRSIAGPGGHRAYSAAVAERTIPAPVVVGVGHGPAAMDSPRTLVAQSNWMTGDIPWCRGRRPNVERVHPRPRLAFRGTGPNRREAERFDLRRRCKHIPIAQWISLHLVVDCR